MAIPAAAPVVGATAAGAARARDLRAGWWTTLPRTRDSVFPTERRREKEPPALLFRIIDDLVQWGEHDAMKRCWSGRARRICRAALRLRRERGSPRAKNCSDRQQSCRLSMTPRRGGAAPRSAAARARRRTASILNHVAVLQSQAMIEDPPKCSGRPPGEPTGPRKELLAAGWHGKGAAGLAEEGVVRLLRPVDARRGREAHRSPLPQASSDRRKPKRGWT